MLTRAERRREERKNTKLAKWLLKLNSDQRQLLTKYCIEATKSDIIALQEAYIRVLRPLLHEGTDGDIETAEKILNDIISKVEQEGLAIRKFENGSVEYMANIKKEKGNIIEIYSGLISNGISDKEAYAELKAAYPMFTASALKNVIAEYKRDKKKAAAKKPNNEAEQEIELNPNMSTEEIAKVIVNCGGIPESENKAHTEENEVKGKIIRQEEKESTDKAIDKQNEEIKTSLVEITEVRKFRGKFGEYEKTKDGVRVNELTVTSMSDIDSLKKQVDDKYDEELQNFLKNQEARKNISYGRLGEIEQLLSM